LKDCRDNYAPPVKTTQDLAAAWAGAVDEVYRLYFEWEEYDWRGPVLGPIRLSFKIIDDALLDMRIDPDPARQAGFLRKLAHHVCPDPRPFDDWWKACVTRLERFHAIDVELAEYEPDLFENFPNMGSPVPPEAYDPRHPYDPVHNVESWDRYLQGLDPGSNIFLRSVEEFEDLASALPAPPYRYAVALPPRNGIFMWSSEC
jgi:hypothetical protein